MINCCSICVHPHERDREEAGESEELIRPVAGGRDAPFRTDTERAALAPTEAFTRHRLRAKSGRTAGLWRARDQSVLVTIDPG
jgi:alkylhydroperoxidase family enzyme